MEKRKNQSLLDGLEQFDTLRHALRAGNCPTCVIGLGGIHKAHFIYSLAAGEESPALVITPDEASAVRMAEDINALWGGEYAAPFPARQLTLREVEGASLEYEHARLGVLSSLAHGSLRVVTASAEAALLHTIPPEALRRHTLELRCTESYNIEELVEVLISCGYTRAEQVEGVCQFALRGGILDIFAPLYPDPLRIEFWGDEIDSIWTFKVESQRRENPLESVQITPAREVLLGEPAALVRKLQAQAKTLRGKFAARAREHIEADVERIAGGATLQNIDKYIALLYEQPATLFEHFYKPTIFVCEPITCVQALKNSRWQLDEDTAALLEEGVLFPALCDFYDDFAALTARLCKNRSVVMDTFARSMADIPLKELLQVSAIQLSSWSGDLSVLVDDLQNFLSQRYRVLIYAGGEKAAATLCADLIKEGIDAALSPDGACAPGKVSVTAGTLSAGFEYPEIKLAVLTHQKHRQVAPKRRGRHKKGEALKSLSDLTPGDYVVHVSHGIGVFEGIIKREIHGVTKDYIKIRYAGTDALFVPVNQLDMVSRYVGGSDDKAVRLNKLNSLEWQKTRQRVKKAVDEMAGELIKLYGQRMNTKGYAFPEDDDWQRDFDGRFEYEETDDQLRCIQEIKADMCRPVPMDRLLCGDVGFGKTEVALRAAFKCVEAGKQCAVLVPTTILAWQHFGTIRRRFEGFPVTVELLSRFRTPKQQAEVVRRLKKGEVDIVVGTHRVVQKDVEFKDLGLVVIDEEQRFGVAHKERFKQLRTNVDVLTLSATPIPRTLNMAMSGIRDMSTIEEAPVDRRPVQTYVLEHDWGVIAEAVRRELRRDGQVFYLHNRIDSIHSTAKRLQELLPDARITVAHGRMNEEELSNIWQQLIDHEIDVLVCTTIIETGVDVANCNTLIIEDADNMGLSQLYQLRGRVGRSSRRAFAYFTFRPGKELSDVASKRLSAIREFTSFGSGFRIAMRDLEIRGAGNILGAAQHGHMESVGYEMYLKLLSDAVMEQKGEPVQQRSEACMIDLRVSAHIPEEYIQNLTQRIDIYKKIAAIGSDEDARDVIDELIDRFGEPPLAVLGLIDVSLLRNMAANLGISEIQQRDDAVLLFQEPLDMKGAGLLASRLKGRVMVSGGKRPYIAVRLRPGEDILEEMRTILQNMREDEPAAQKQE
ncbi:transcription-repair coupling factor [Harryflintia acetispora]|uniref:transcription-repair coupling factor n=1 Tax=Harryflintia acetispora TaxID=1849041 RepID=UPI0018982430|nr:transcription-repair coupling factor [Harryflintia acetispora]